MAATFSIIIPTVGRPSVVATLASVVTQLGPGDEILLIRNDDGDWGGAARNGAIERARASHLIFIDDDDEYTPGAIRAMREFATQHPDRIGIFRMRWEFWYEGEYGRLHWQEPAMRISNVSTQMFVVPNIPSKVGHWDPSWRGGDWSFIQETVALQGEPIFCDTVVARIRPDRRNAVIRTLDVYLRISPRLDVLKRKLHPRRAKGLARCLRRAVRRP